MRSHLYVKTLLQLVLLLLPLFRFGNRRAARLMTGASFVPPQSSTRGTTGVVEESLACLLPGAAEVYGAFLQYGQI